MAALAMQNIELKNTTFQQFLASDIAIVKSPTKNNLKI
jgi:hypothetical protein